MELCINDELKFKFGEFLKIVLKVDFFISLNKDLFIK